MTANEFRRLALGLPNVVESAHMGHPDFRVAGKIFATLGYPKSGWGVVCLTPDQQELFVRTEPKSFVPVKGGWGRAGNTNVLLPQARKAAVREALIKAWRNRAPKTLLVGLIVVSLLGSACSKPGAAPRPVAPVVSRTVPASDQTIIAEVEPSFDGQSVYVVNNSSFPIVVTSIRLVECVNIASPCTLIPLKVRVKPSNRTRVFDIRPADRERGYSYRYTWTWSAATR
jgi:hypothetical protein